MFSDDFIGELISTLFNLCIKTKWTMVAILVTRTVKFRDG